VKRFTIDVAPGGLEQRIIGPDGWQGPWRSTEYHGRLQIESDRRKRRISVFVGNSLGCMMVATGIAWMAALSALGVWVVLKLISGW
jgi:hypothetical protein